MFGIDTRVIAHCGGRARVNADLAVLAGIGLLVYELNLPRRATKDGTRPMLLTLRRERDAL